jgi:hypothetical protein
MMDELRTDLERAEYLTNLLIAAASIALFLVETTKKEPRVIL